MIDMGQKILFVKYFDLDLRIIKLCANKARYVWDKSENLILDLPDNKKLLYNNNNNTTTTTNNNNNNNDL